MDTKIICVFKNTEIFDKVVKNNENLNDCKIFAYDNTQENVSITKRYNNFIDKNVLSLNTKEDFWCVFIHQDFGFMEKISEIIDPLDTNCIYGAMGVRFLHGVFIGKKGLERKLGLKNKLKVLIGRFLQGNNDFNFKEMGYKVNRPYPVETVDCCCIIIHSSLIKKHNLKFDENLNFHMYAEELCYRAKKDYKIKIKVIQIKCYHLGSGALNKAYQESVQYLKEKFKVDEVPSTCPN